MSTAREQRLGEIGRPSPRPETLRFVAGAGRYVDDIELPRQLHAAFLRSPFAHARVHAIDTAEARGMDGVAGVFTAADIDRICKPFQCVTSAAPGLISPAQHALAVAETVYQGEPVAVVVAVSRAIAEDAVEAIKVEWEELPAVTELADALDADAARTHSELSSNLAWRTSIDVGDIDTVFSNATLVVQQSFDFARHTGVTLEPRGMLAHWDPVAQSLLVYVSHQMPHQLQLHLAESLSIPLSRVRVICPDVGGGFGIKMHIYPDELAVCAASRLLGRPVRFIADRIEGLASDIHAREARVAARMAVSADGHILGFDIAHRHGIGAYSVFPRSSTAEAMGVMRTIGAPYRFDAYRAKLDVVMQNKVMTGQYRAVGHPIACTLTEHLVDRAARARNEDPLEMRRRNLVRAESMPWVNPAGGRMFELSHHACLDRLIELVNVAALRANIAAWRHAGRRVGLGFAAFVEFTATGSEGYGNAGVPVAAVDTVVLTLGPDGDINAAASVSEIGQGIRHGLAQVIADAVGLPASRVTVHTGDTATVPHGGGAWASRGAAIGGEAAWGAGCLLKSEILRIAAAMLQGRPQDFELRDGIVQDASGTARLTFKDIAHISLFKGHELPSGTSPQLTVSHQYRRERDAMIPTNGIQASLVEVDGDTGLVTPLQHWVVEDCGRIINPLLVGEQIRGGVIQGIGEALLEACRYDESGQLVSGSLAEYLVPMAFEMPDIAIAHIETPYSGSVIGAKGVGEAGTCAAAAAVLNAVNDALAGDGISVAALPISPVAIVDALRPGALA